MDILIKQLKVGFAGDDEQRVQSLAPGDDGAAIRGTTRGDRAATPILRSAQETTRQSGVQGLPEQAADRTVSGKQQAIASTARRTNKPTAEARAPTGARHAPGSVHHIPPRADVRLRRLISFIGLAIVVIGAVWWLWIATGPQESTTAVKPVANTASTPQDSTTTATSGAQNRASPSEWDKLQEKMRALSKTQEEMSKVLDEQNQEASKAIEMIKKRQ
jgi:hypothetical protein